MKDEFRFIERLKSLIPRSLQGPFGIGDDAAILPGPAGKDFLFMTDVIVEGIDFRLGRGGASWEEVGHKALAVNLSDLAAMGGRPVAFVTAWGIPRNYSERGMERAARGMLRLARRFRAAWVGGDLSRSSRLFISVALLGEVKKGKAVPRNGARAGDEIFVTGRLGGSILGKHLSFTPRIAEGEFLARNFSLTSMIDLSDGLVQDLGHLLQASRAGARIELGRIPISKEVFRLARKAGRRALRSALSDGEDFELLFTLPGSRARRLEKAWPRRFPRVPLTRIGVVVRSRPGRIEWYEKERLLRKLWFRKKGFVHF